MLLHYVYILVIWACIPWACSALSAASMVAGNSKSTNPNPLHFLVNRGFVFEPVLWSLVPCPGGPGLCSMEGWQGTLFFLSFFLPGILALAVHVSLSMPTSIQVIACFDSFWCDTLVSFKLMPSPFLYGVRFFTFIDLGGLSSLP